MLCPHMGLVFITRGCAPTMVRAQPVSCRPLRWHKIGVNRGRLTGLSRYQPYESYFDLTGGAQALGE